MHVDVAGTSAADQARWPVVRSMTDHHDPLVALCRHLLALGESSDPRAADRVADVVSLLLTRFVDGPLVGATETAPPDWVGALAGALARAWEDGIARPVPLAQLAAAVGRSPRTLSASSPTGTAPAWSAECSCCAWPGRCLSCG